MADAEPAKLGKYEIIEEVGGGGFALVYKALDTTLNRTVRLKTAKPHSMPGLIASNHQENQSWGSGS